MEYESSVLIIRFLMHCLTVVTILLYRPRGSQFRLSASICAALLAGSSAALAMQILTTWNTLITAEPMPWLIVFHGVVLWKLLKARGNIAKMFPTTHKEIQNG